MTTDVKELVKRCGAVMRVMIRFPNALQIMANGDGRAVTISAKAHPADIGFLIGKGAATHKALGELFRRLGRQLDLHVLFGRLLEPDDIEAEQTEAEWVLKPSEIKELLVRTLLHLVDKPEHVEVKFTDHDEIRATTAIVRLDSSIPEHAAIKIAGSVSYLFDLIGKRHGHNMNVCFETSRGLIERQPVTAKGRHTREV